MCCHVNFSPVSTETDTSPCQSRGQKVKQRKEKEKGLIGPPVFQVSLKIQLFMIFLPSSQNTAIHLSFYFTQF